MRSLLFASVLMVLVGCGGSTHEASPAPVPLPHVLATASVAVRPEPNDATSTVRHAIVHMLELLDAGQDERFIDEAVVPEEIARVLGNRTKAELVEQFKNDKHDGIVRMFRRVREAEPKTVRVDGARTYITFDGGDDRDVTFVVEGGHVYIKN